MKIHSFFIRISFFLCLLPSMLLGMYGKDGVCVHSNITTEELRSILRDTVPPGISALEMSAIVQQMPQPMGGQELRAILRETIPNQMHHTHDIPAEDVERAARRIKTVFLEGVEQYEADHGNETARQRIAQRREEEQRRQADNLRRLEAERLRHQAETQRLNTEYRLQQERLHTEQTAFKREALDKLSKAAMVALCIGLIYLGYKNYTKTPLSTKVKEL